MLGKGGEAELVERLATILRSAPSLMQVLTTIRALDLPDWLMMSGAVYQRVLNALTGRPPEPSEPSSVTKRNRKFVDSLLEETGFETSVPECARTGPWCDAA